MCLEIRSPEKRHTSTDAGHQGQDGTFSLVKQRFYQSSLERDVRDHVKRCARCAVGKTPEPDDRAPLESIKMSRPLELVCIDFWTAELPC